MDELRRTRAGTAYVVAPESGAGPGVLVLHAWWGLTPFFKAVADRLADVGFVALAPDLFAGCTAQTPEEAEVLLAEADATAMVGLIESSLTVLQGLPATPEAPVGVLGFSMGGSLGLRAATRRPDDVGAVSVFYGLTDVDFAPLRAAVQGHFAEFDEFDSEDDVVAMEAHMRLVGLYPEIHRYRGTAHWFFESDREVAYSPEAAELAWERTVSFLRRHLDDAGSSGGEP